MESHISEHLTPVTGLELQKQEQKPSKNGRQLQVALRNSPLLSNTHDADLATMLKYIMVKVGLKAKNLPSDIEKKVLLDHIKKSYPGNTLDEIRLAFDLALAEELNLNPADIPCYENFSCAYFSRIMNAYLTWAANEYKQLHHEPPTQKIYTDEENDNLHRQLTEELYIRLKRGYYEPIPDYVKAILVKDGLLKQEDSVSNFFVQKLGKQAPHIYEKVQ